MFLQRLHRVGRLLCLLRHLQLHGLQKVVLLRAVSLLLYQPPVLLTPLQLVILLQSLPLILTPRLLLRLLLLLLLQPRQPQAIRPP